MLRIDRRDTHRVRVERLRLAGVSQPAFELLDRVITEILAFEGKAGRRAAQVRNVDAVVLVCHDGSASG